MTICHFETDGIPPHPMPPGVWEPIQTGEVTGEPGALILLMEDGFVHIDSMGMFVKPPPFPKDLSR